MLEFTPAPQSARERQKFSPLERLLFKPQEGEGAWSTLPIWIFLQNTAVPPPLPRSSICRPASSPVDPRFPVIPPDACMPCQSAPKKRKTFLASAGSKSRLRIWCYTKELPQLDTSELSDGDSTFPRAAPP
ncbi:hypothetical protein TWF132_001506 [Orbilia oligospora]|nr:hypothetical protein TWF751_004111 [Orbilia oligospora]KAF3295457.1 hypothetical protein TWF132_001506 [Orbilia oligospora]